MAHESLDELLQQTATLRRLALDLVGEAHADDVLQETAIQAMRSPPARSGSMMGWLTVVVRRLASKQRRADRVRRRHELEAVRSDVQPADRSIEDADSLRRLTEIVTTLPEPYRGTILARYLRDLSPSEIATERGEPVRTVKTRLQRGLGMLRERLDERTADWRPGLIAAFGLEPTTKVAVTAAGILLMNITTKFVLATAALLLAGVIAWQFVGREAPTVNERAQGPGPVAVAPPSLPEPIASGPPARVAVPVAPAVPSDPKVAVDGAVRSDEIVVHALDATTNAPIERFGLRTVIMPNQNLLAPENPLLHEGQHPEGRLVLPAADFEQRTFQLEDSEHRYLTSRWFTLADVVLHDGVRRIEVKLPLPMEVTLTIVREHGGAPVAGTKVELVRPWINSPQVTVHTNVQTAERFRAQLGETEMVMKFLGGRGLLLSGGETDAAGRIHLRVPPDEALALRLLGPGHQPVVRQPWRVPASTEPADVVETVTSGGVIRGRVLPIEALRKWSPELPNAEPGIRSQLSQASLAAGLRLRHKGSGETIPTARMPFTPRTPLAADGTFAVDGLKAGDWTVLFGYPLRVQELEIDPRLVGKANTSSIGLENMEFELSTIVGLTDHELRVLDIDISTFTPGQLDANVTRDGKTVSDGAMLVTPIAATSAPLPILRSSPNLRFGKTGRIVATLPPARYAARWSFQGSRDFPYLGTFEVRSGDVTRIDFVIDTVTQSLRVVESDGATAASGQLQLNLTRDGEPASWSAYRVVDATGLAEFTDLPRDTVLQVQFVRKPTPQPAGTLPPPTTPIDLGTVTADSTGEPVVLKLPPR